jgi:hypothetical protein
MSEIGPDLDFDLKCAVKHVELAQPSEALDYPNPYGLLSPRDVDRLCSETHRSKSFVEGLISHGTVSVLVGDSGLGKSPLAYQLGLCVAQGLPFLGMKTHRGSVVYADYENGLSGSKEIRDSLVQFLGIDSAPEEFSLWTADASDGGLNIDGVCQDVRPDLVILDTLRSHNPYFEKSDNTGAAMAHLRSLSAKHQTSILAIHHVRKPGPEGVPSLDREEVSVIEWLNQASGHRSLINQSDTRIASSHPGGTRAGELVLRWHRRIHGERGPLYVERVCDENGKPIGYRPIAGVKLLNNPEQEAAYLKLPEEFAFKQAKQIYARSDDPTRKWLIKCESAGLIKQIGRGTYQKFGPEP